MTVSHPGANKAINQAVRQAFADCALLDAVPCEAAHARQRAGQVFWSWLDILEPFQGTLALVQPVELAQEVAAAILNSDGKEAKLDEVLDAQCELTNIIAGRAFTALLPGQQVRLGTPSSGQGAPDVRQGDWLGQTFSVGDLWVAVFLKCPTLFANRMPGSSAPETARLRPSEAPATETESMSAALEAKPASPGRSSVRSSLAQERRVIPDEESSARVEAPVARSEAQRRADNKLSAAPTQPPIVPIQPPAPPPPPLAPPTPRARAPEKPPVASPPAPRPAESAKPPQPNAGPGQRAAAPTAKPSAAPTAAPTTKGGPPIVPPDPARLSPGESSVSASSGRRAVVRTIDGLCAVSPDGRPATPPRAPYQVPRIVSAGDFSVPACIGHYQVLGAIGAGPSGMVFKAQHRTLGRLVALKVMPPSLAGDRAYATRFLAEARVAAALEHPHLVTVYDASNEDGFLYIAMRYLEAGDLRHALERDGVLEEARAISVFSDCLRALVFLHGKGHVHGNLHPGNILFDEMGKARIVDFGVVSLVSATDGGTGLFKSPAQLSGAPRAASHDLYSLGVTLYTALTGQAPYPEGGNVDAFILGGEAADVRVHAPGVSDALCRVVAKAIHRQPETCYHEAQSFLDDLLNAGAVVDNQVNASGVNWFGKLFGSKGPKE
jgi:chemotaxis protein CheY-P-specific phosphatase CheC